MACLVAASAADAEYIILRVVMNRGPDEAGPGGPGGPVSPGGPGRPGGMVGMIGGPGSPGE